MDAAASAWERFAHLDHRAVDGVIALALTVLTQIQLADVGPAGRAALLLTLVVAFRRTAPLATAAAVSFAIAAQGLTDNPPSVLGEYLTVTLATYTVAAECPRREAALGGLLILIGIVLHDLRSEEYGSLSGIASDLSTPVLFWGVGRAVRVSRRRVMVARDAVERTALEAREQERRHIARELHDVVTHSLGIVVLQAQGAERYLDDREPRVAEALRTIEVSGRTAMTEMRRLLGLLREDDGSRPELRPQPSIGQLDELAGQLRRSGLDVELRVDGEAVLPAGVELSAYRIVQEALTNTLRHADARTAHVVVGLDADGITIDITDDGHGGAAAAPGRGLLGMQERVALYGGRLEHGPRDAGGYRVAAWLPAAGDPA
jgi:signal transduction histidine kinase